MNVSDVQMVLNRIVEIYEGISPQILRSAIEYAKFQSTTSTLDTDDGTGGKTPLLLRTQGYIEGYCHIFDEYYNPDAIDIATNEFTEDVMSGIQADYGEEAPTSIISACADFAAVIAANRHPDSSYAEVSEVVRLSSIGYMDGALDADTDIQYGKFIRHMNKGYSLEDAGKAYDIVASEIHLNVEDEESATALRTSTTACLSDMMDTLVYPKSGNGEISTEDPLICAMLYILGYLRGIANASENEEGADSVEETETLNDNEGTVKDVEKYLVSMWCRYNGYPERIIDDACASMEKEISESMTNGEEDDDARLATLYGIGYADGAWMTSQDDDVSSEELREMEISEEIDKVFADMIVGD